MLGCLLLVSFLILSKQAAEVSETMSSTENSKIILVDAGHGGADPGMIGVNGLEEKGINLQIAVKLKDSLEKQGFSVIMTREEDKGLYKEDSRNQKAQDMQCRIAMIKKYRPVLCISVHQNSYQDSSVCGPRCLLLRFCPGKESGRVYPGRTESGTESKNALVWQKVIKPIIC